MRVCITVILLVIEVAAACGTTHDELTLTRNGSTVEVANGLVKAIFVPEGMTVAQKFYAFGQGKWEAVAESFCPSKPIPPEATQLFNSSINPNYRYLVSEIVTGLEVERNDSHEIVVRITGRKGTALVIERVKLEPGKRYFHVTVSADLGATPAKLDYLLSTFTFNLDHAPFFVHTPGLKFDNEDSKQNLFKLLSGKDQVIGDRAFHAPAVILQEKQLFFAVVPDLKSINANAVPSPDARRTLDIPRNIFSVPFDDDKYTMPTGLDLNVRTGLTEKPVVSFGYMDNIIAHHIHYQRVNDSTMVRTVGRSTLEYAFDLFAGADTPESTGYQQVARHQWEQYGHEVFLNRPHLAMPFEEYYRIVDSITFHPMHSKDIDVPLAGYEDMGSWLEFDLNGLPVGGYRSAIPWWNDVMHNSVFWNNARDALGFHFWGMKLNNPKLLERAHRIINFCLSAQKNSQGLFSTLFNANTRAWGPGFTDPPHGKNEFFLRESESYDIPALSKTAAYLVDYYLNCEKDERIIDYLRSYADWLVRAIDERGAVPSYVTSKMEFSPILFHSAQPSASLWFLSLFAKATGEKKYTDGAKRIAEFLEREILPEAKWVDMEQYFSCGKKPLSFERDTWQHQIARGNLATIWACQGFAALYTATGDDRYLKMGEQAVDYTSFSQCVWEPHFIYTAFPFGGFTADNADNATMLDARQAEMVKPFVWYGKMLGRQDLLERGIAAARASVVLLNLPAHKANNIYRHTNIYPYGLGPENIDHEAHPQSAMRTHPGWGEGSGVFTGLADAYQALGGLYINYEKKMAVGVNGLRVTEAKFGKNVVMLKVESLLCGKFLKLPWDGAFNTSVIIDGSPEQVVLNGKRIDNPLREIKLRVLPTGGITVQD
jgi:hypothetical protein